jgi:hypothetical protein
MLAHSLISLLFVLLLRFACSDTFRQSIVVAMFDRTVELTLSSLLLNFANIQ